MAAEKLRWSPTATAYDTGSSGFNTAVAKDTGVKDCTAAPSSAR